MESALDIDVGDDLFTHNGHHVGKFHGDRVYNVTGAQLLSLGLKLPG